MLFFNFRKNSEKHLSSESHLWSESFQDNSPVQKSIAISKERKYFRVDTQIILKFWPLDAEHEVSSLPIQYQVNLSGCGIRFPVRRPALLFGQFGLEIRLPDRNSEVPILCSGTVVRRFRNENHQPEIALEFSDISEKDRDRIVSYCFSVQRKNLREKVRVSSQPLDS